MLPIWSDSIHHSLIFDERETTESIDAIVNIEGHTMVFAEDLITACPSMTSIGNQ